MRFESVFGFGFGGAFTLFADCLNTLALGQKKPEAFRGCKMMIVFARRAFRRAARRRRRKSETSGFSFSFDPP
jgi:hypothetical protein